MVFIKLDSVKKINNNQTRKTLKITKIIEISFWF